MPTGREKDETAREVSGHHQLMAGNGSACSAFGPAVADRDAAELDRYLDHLVELDMPVSMKIELIRVLRVIMQSFVDRAFGDDPVQLCSDRKVTASKSDASTSSDMLRSSFNHDVK